MKREAMNCPRGDNFRNGHILRPETTLIRMLRCSRLQPSLLRNSLPRPSLLRPSLLQVPPLLHGRHLCAPAQREILQGQPGDSELIRCAQARFQ